MKICFFLHRQFAYIGHAMALLLKESYGVNDFCGYVYLRSSYQFLMSQKDIVYSNLLLDEDVRKKYQSEQIDMVYLKELERDYGIPNLWAYVAADRILMSNQLVREYPYDTPSYSYEDALKILQVTAKALTSFLDKERPDALVVSPALGGLGNLLLYHLCKKRGIATWSINTTGIRDTYILSEHHIRFSSIEKRFKEDFAAGIKKEPYYSAAKKLIEDFRKNPLPHYAKLAPAEQPINRKTQLRFLLPTNFIRSFSFFLRTVGNYFSAERSDYSYISPLNYLKDHAKRKIRNLIGASDLYDHIEPNELLVFFPLQAEPEASLSVWAPFKTNQLEVIRQIAKSLPIDYKLCVKEHPLMVQYRPRAYYKEIKKVLNVKLINPAVRGVDLLERSELIITTTGTLGFEAMFLKKPSITLGEMWYDCLSFSKSCRAMEDLPALIKDRLENFRYNEEEMRQFISSLLEESAYLDFRYLWEEETDIQKKKDGLRPLVDLLAKKLNLHAAKVL